jgi:hypothetical protein
MLQFFFGIAILTIIYVPFAHQFDGQKSSVVLVRNNPA